MRNPVLKRFSVFGQARFPHDILRSDQCWPATPQDAAAIAPPDDRPATRAITLETAAKYAPDRQRWRMAGWKVAD